MGITNDAMYAARDAVGSPLNNSTHFQCYIYEHADMKYRPSLISRYSLNDASIARKTAESKFRERFQPDETSLRRCFEGNEGLLVISCR